MGADRRMTSGQILVMAAHHRVEPGGMLDQAVLLVDPDGRERRGARDRVARVGQAAVVERRVEVLRDLVVHRDGPERQIRRGQALGHRHEIRDRVPVVDREPAPSAAPSLSTDPSPWLSIQLRRWRRRRR